MVEILIYVSQLQAVGGEDEDDEHAPFMRKPFCIYRGHTADLLDLSWSKACIYCDNNKKLLTKGLLIN